MQRDDDVEIPSLTLDQDEVSERRPNKAVPKARSTPTPTKPIHAPNVVHKKANLIGIYLLLVIILCISAGAGYWLWQQNMQLRSEIYGARNEIQNLDHQLLAADVSANQQGQTLEETLKNHDSEIRKLWAIAYDRNRNTIADNGKTIEALEKQVATLKATLSTQSKRLAIQSEVLNDIEAGYNKLVPSVASIDEVVKNIAVTQENQAKRIGSLDAKNVDQALIVKIIQQDLTTIQQKIASFENKAADISEADLVTIQQTLISHQDAINSSDTFRTQVNSEIIRLRKQINQLMLEQQLSVE